MQECRCTSMLSLQLLYDKPLSDLLEGRIGENLLGGDEQVPPFFVAVGLGPAGGGGAVLNRPLLLRQNVIIVQLIFAFDLHKVNHGFCFHHKVRLIVVAIVL